MRRSEDLACVEVVENGHRFVTGVPVTIPFVRNTEPAPFHGSRFQQDIEPAGLYMNLDWFPSDPPPRRWEKGIVEFRTPLVLMHNTGSSHSVAYDEWSWKARLHHLYKKRGAALSRALLADGYDAIVTVTTQNGMPIETNEIVALAKVRA